MHTTTLRDSVRAAASLIPDAIIWLNGLGFDTTGADGQLYQVTRDERTAAALWCAATSDGYGHGYHVLTALANAGTAPAGKD